jgi:tetratricopeptide (TPR) repeat protein
MENLSFDFLEVADESLEIARRHFDRREYEAALAAITAMPSLLRARSDVLELEARTHQSLLHYEAAIEAWERLLAADPDNTVASRNLPPCYERLGIALVFVDVLPKFKAAKFRETLEALDQGPPEWRHHAEFYRLKASSHERLGQHDEAVDAWQNLLALSPGHIEAAVRIPVCLAYSGRREEAAEGMRDIAERYPDHMRAQFNWISFELDRRGMSRGLPIALAEIDQLRARAGASKDFGAQLEVFRTKLLGLVQVDDLLAKDVNDVLQLRSRPAVVGDGLTAIYEQFEPVGNNCEFGSAQRRHGAEPMALLRWTQVQPESLIRMLADRFEGYEKPERYHLHGNPQFEYMLRETEYGTVSHTRVNIAEVQDANALLAQLTRRQAFLKRKFMETAAEGEKIFVYKTDGRLDDTQVDRIHAGLDSIGVRKVLIVMRAEGDEKAGSVRIQRPGLVLGFLPDALPHARFDHWNRIVRACHKHFNKR